MCEGVPQDDLIAEALQTRHNLQTPVEAVYVQDGSVIGRSYLVVCVCSEDVLLNHLLVSELHMLRVWTQHG